MPRPLTTDPAVRALRAELRALVRTWARIWQLPPECWGALGDAAHARAEEIVLLLEVD